MGRRSESLRPEPVRSPLQRVRFAMPEVIDVKPAPLFERAHDRPRLPLVLPRFIFERRVRGFTSLLKSKWLRSETQLSIGRAARSTPSRTGGHSRPTRVEAGLAGDIP